MTTALIGPDALADRLGQDGLVVFDASMPLPGEAWDARAAWRERHLPGARFLDLDLFADPDGDLPHTVPAAARFAALARAEGVSDASDVVVYDSRQPFSAPRAWWLFRLFGHDRVRMLDGGLPAWVAHGLPVERGEVPDPAPGTLVARLRARLLAGLGDVDRADPSTSVLIDARPAARFDGTAPEPRPGVARGRIAGSRSLPFARLFAPDGTLRTPDDLRALLGEAGVEPGVTVIASCGTGIAASGIALAMAEAGLGEAAVYDGSWTEYARDGRRREPAG